MVASPSGLLAGKTSDMDGTWVRIHGGFDRGNGIGTGSGQSKRVGLLAGTERVMNHRLTKVDDNEMWTYVNCVCDVGGRRDRDWGFRTLSPQPSNCR